MGSRIHREVYVRFRGEAMETYLGNKERRYGLSLQSEKESDALKQPMIDLLKKYNIDYIEANGDIEGYDWIVNDVLNRLENNY